VSFRPKPLGARAAIISSAGATVADDLKGALIYGPISGAGLRQKQTETGLYSGSKTLPRGRERSTGARSSSLPRTTQGNSDLAKSALAEAYEMRAPT
jgi:hypothetical protein